MAFHQKGVLFHSGILLFLAYSWLLCPLKLKIVCNQNGRLQNPNAMSASPVPGTFQAPMCFCLAKERGMAEHSGQRQAVKMSFGEFWSSSGKMKDFQTGHQDVVEANSKWWLTKLALSVSFISHNPKG